MVDEPRLVTDSDRVELTRMASSTVLAQPQPLHLESAAADITTKARRGRATLNQIKSQTDP